MIIEILANLCWTPPLFSGRYISLWSSYWDTICDIWQGIDSPIKWCNRLINKPISPRATAPQRQYSELLLLSLYYYSICSKYGVGIVMSEGIIYLRLRIMLLVWILWADVLSWQRMEWCVTSDIRAWRKPSDWRRAADISAARAERDLVVRGVGPWISEETDAV